MVVKNDLFDYKNRYIFQDEEGFKFSLDSILLAEFSKTTTDGLNILDMCAGNMAVPLIMSTYSKSNFYGFEIQREIYFLGNNSIIENKLQNNLKIINDDVNNIEKYFKSDFFDIIVCNPPFFKITEKSNLNKSDKLSIARHELKINLEQIFSVAKKFLKNNGCLYIIHRSERLDEIINNAIKYNVKVKEIQMIKTKKDKKPTTVIVKCIKNSRFGVKINSEVCIEGKNTYQNLFEGKK